MKQEVINFIRDEEAQTSVEYILLLAIAVGFVVLVYRSLLKPILGGMGQRFEERIDRFFQRGGFHRFPFRG